MSCDKDFQNNKQFEAQDQSTTTDEELTISTEGNQTIDEPPNLSSTPSTPSTPSDELGVEDTGTTSTTEGEENAQILAPYYAIALLLSIVVVEEDGLAESDDNTALPETNVTRVGNDYIAQPPPTSNDIQGFKTNEPSQIGTTSTSTATVAGSIPASSIDNESTGKEWVLENNKSLPNIPNNGAWVLPNVSSTTHSDPPDCEATSWEEEKPVEAIRPEPIEDQGGGGGSASCLLVLPSIDWKALRQMNDDENEIVVSPEKPFEPPEDSSDHSSDAD